jgi:hypothetical protein
MGVTRSKRSIRWAAGCILCLASPVQADACATSYYFASAFGPFLTAVPPEPSFSAGSQMLLFNGSSQRAVLSGRADLVMRESEMDRE